MWKQLIFWFVVSCVCCVSFEPNYILHILIVSLQKTERYYPLSSNTNQIPLHFLLRVIQFPLTCADASAALCPSRWIRFSKNFKMITQTWKNSWMNINLSTHHTPASEFWKRHLEKNMQSLQLQTARSFNRRFLSHPNLRNFTHFPVSFENF